MGEIMQKKHLKESQRQLELDIAKKIKDGELSEGQVSRAFAELEKEKEPAKKKRRWDETPAGEPGQEATLGEDQGQENDEPEVPSHLAKTPAIGNKWDATPAHI